jgi:putative ABC transport system ATP-binding protein
MTTMIWMESITKTYRLGEVDVPVLKGIDLSIEEGEYVAIMGMSGSGKSTLMNIIGCLDRPTTGHYVLEGRNLTTFDDDELAYIRNQRIGFVFQQFNLLSRATALDNVMLPMVYANVPKPQRRQRAIEALTRVGLGDRINNRPSQLSGGQPQLPTKSWNC